MQVTHQPFVLPKPKIKVSRDFGGYFIIEVSIPYSALQRTGKVIVQLQRYKRRKKETCNAIGGGRKIRYRQARWVFAGNTMATGKNEAQEFAVDGVNITPAGLGYYKFSYILSASQWFSGGTGRGKGLWNKTSSHYLRLVYTVRKPVLAAVASNVQTALNGEPTLVNFVSLPSDTLKLSRNPHSGTFSLSIV